MKRAILWKTMMNQEEEAPDDIRGTIDKTEFDELLALKKDLASGPDGIPFGARRCAGGLGSQFLLNAYRSYGSRAFC